MVGDFPKRCTRRGTTRISRVRCDKAKRGWASRVARVARRNGAPHGRGDGGESDPPFFAAGAPRAREKVSAKVSALCPPFGEVALTTVIPGGKAIERLGIQRRLNVSSWLRVLTDEALEEQSTTDGQRPRRARLEDAHNPISPIRTQGHSTTPLDGLGRRVSGVE